jgi:hypothetical protein
MSLFYGALIGAGLGLLKHRDEKAQARAMNQAAADQTRYSWASGMGPGQIQKSPSLYGNLLQGGLTGAAMGQAYGAAQKAAAEEAAKKATEEAAQSAVAESGALAAPASAPGPGPYANQMSGQQEMDWYQKKMRGGAMTGFRKPF